MRLTFPNGEHAAVAIEQGQVGVGSAAGGGTAVAIAGLAPLHAVFASGRRGAWLTVPQGATVVLNARPVKRIAYLRAGDLVCLGGVQVRVEASRPPDEPPEVPPSRRRLEDAALPRAALRGLSGPWFGRSAPIAGPRVLGRGAASDIRLDGAGILDRHAQVDIEFGKVVVRTLAAGATLRVNGHPVRAATLGPGDQIEIAEHRFALEAPGSSGGGDVGSTPPPSARPHPSASPEGSASVPADSPAGRDLSGVYLLIAAAAALAAALTAFFVYAPKA